MPKFTFDTFLALVAIAMSLPPLIAIFFGRPKPLLDFTSAPNGEILFCHVEHSPLSVIQRHLGIRREPEHVTAMFSVRTAETNQLMGENTHAIFLLGESLRPNINGYLGFENPLMFSVVQFNGERAELSRRTEFDSTVTLPHGRYLCEIVLSFPQRNMKMTFYKQFIAGRPGEMRWI